MTRSECLSQIREADNARRQSSQLDGHLQTYMYLGSHIVLHIRDARPHCITGPKLQQSKCIELYVIPRLVRCVQHTMISCAA